ncbi:septation protein SepH [Nocardioides sp.]|uniref:septation protein SepH n=1 Tax=Nocardioides sp. TaxID=35761 RepID=UPI002ED53FDC
MAHLTLAGLSSDGKRLLLVSDKGVEFTVDVDERLRAALRGDHARLGQLEIKMDSALRPRDIQARIRAGETPEAVAQAAQTTVDAIMPFAAPVLAERQHVAQRAQRSSVRRTGQSGGARTLGEAIGAHLRGLNIDPETVSWDAARREDGRWNLAGEFSVSGRSGTARFTFDAPGNYVVADNDDAIWLLGDAAPDSSADSPTPANDLERARARRHAYGTAGEPELPLGDDAISLVRGDDAIGAEQPVEAYLDVAPARSEPSDDDRQDDAVEDGDVVAELDAAEQGETDSSEDPSGEEPTEPTRRKPAKKRGRASVPSWDEIMFGGSSGSDHA